MLDLQILRIQLCPKKGIYPLKSYSGDDFETINLTSSEDVWILGDFHVLRLRALFPVPFSSYSFHFKKNAAQVDFGPR